MVPGTILGHEGVGVVEEAGKEHPVGIVGPNILVNLNKIDPIGQQAR